MSRLLVPTALAAQAGADSVAHPISLDEAVTLAQRNSPTTVQAAGTTRSNAAVRAVGVHGVHSVAELQHRRKQAERRSLRLAGRARSVHRRRVAVLERSANERRPVRWRQPPLPASRARRPTSTRPRRTRRSSSTTSRSTSSSSTTQCSPRVKSESAAKAQLDQATEQLKTASAKVAAGAATKSDSLRAIILVGNAQLALIQAQQQPEHRERLAHAARRHAVRGHGNA